MKQKILALLGSGEFTFPMEEVDRFLLSHIENPVIAIIPTAAGLEDDYEKWIKKGETHFQKLGFNVFGVHMLNQDDANSAEILEQLEIANVYYFSGGNPGYLLDVLQNSKAWTVIKQRYESRDALLIGSSAGAMVMGRKVLARIYNFFRTGQLPEWEDGLGLVDFGVIPHFDKIAQDLSQDQIATIVEQMSEGFEIVGIDEDTAYIYKEGKWSKMGEGRVVKPVL